MSDSPTNSAQDLLRKYGIQDTSQISIDDLIWAEGCIYEEKSMTGAEGRIIFHGSKSAIIVIKKDIANFRKKRFVQAHELGHLRLHRSLQPFFHCSSEVFLERNKRGSHESEANSFAAELLMPSLLIKPLLQTEEFSINLLQEIAQRFQTSLTATAFRYIELGPEPIAVFYSANNQIEWNHHSKGFIVNNLKSKVPISPKSLTFKCMVEGVSPSQPELVPAPVWFNSKRIPNDLLFYEHCVLSPRYKGALSFLWMSNQFL